MYEGADRVSGRGDEGVGGGEEGEGGRRRGAVGGRGEEKGWGEGGGG